MGWMQLPPVRITIPLAKTTTRPIRILIHLIHLIHQIHLIRLIHRQRVPCPPAAIH
jgi:hypothetical protein